MKPDLPVDRLPRIGREQFVREYLGKRPLVLTDVVRNWPAACWTPPQLAARAGRVPVTARRYASDSPYTFVQQTFFDTVELPFGEWVDFVAGGSHPELYGERRAWSLRESWEIFRAR